ncbi:MAG: hypothetical protein RI894_419 [Bacteroidota bacterium]|jgi:arsenate reductase
MNQIFHSKSCSTNQRILKEWQAGDNFSYCDIKTEGISAEQLDYLAALAGSYEALFSRVARKYRLMNLHETALDEADYRRLMLEEYTFMKRPIAVVNNKIFIGNTPKTVEAANEAMKLG